MPLQTYTEKYEFPPCQGEIQGIIGEHGNKEFLTYFEKRGKEKVRLYGGTSLGEARGALRGYVFNLIEDSIFYKLLEKSNWFENSCVESCPKLSIEEIVKF